jgi:uncharacterized protein YpmS
VNWKRLFLVLAALLFLSYCAMSVVTILVSRGNESLYVAETNDKTQGASSDMFAKSYSTSHAPCYGQLTGERANGFTPGGPSP